MAEAKQLAVISWHGTLDASYPLLIFSTAAVAMDMQAAIFFTIFGLEIPEKGTAGKLEVAPIANPTMLQPIPVISVPNILGMLPGMTAVAAGMMNGWMKKANVVKVSELLALAQESGVRLIGCQMTIDVMGVKKEDLIDGVEIGGAATFLQIASQDAIAPSC